MFFLFFFTAALKLGDELLYRDFAFGQSEGVEEQKGSGG